MSVDLKAARSRRAILGAGLGAVAASAAAAVGLPSVALAAGDDNQPILVGSQFSDVRSFTLLANSSTNNTVFGASTSGSGDAINASSGTGNGVYGETSAAANSGQAGVYGFSTSGTALASYSPSGVALLVNGRVIMGQNSGVAVLPSGAGSVVVNPGLDIIGQSFVLLTPKGNIRGRSLWYTTNRTANTFTIHISAAKTGATQIAWLLLG